MLAEQTVQGEEVMDGGALCLICGLIGWIWSYFIVYRIGFTRGWEAATRDEKKRGFPVLPPSDQERHC